MTNNTLRQLLIKSLNKRKSVIEIGIVIFSPSHYCISLETNSIYTQQSYTSETKCINDLKLHE